MKRVAIVDYGLCNLDSIRRAIEECGGVAEVTEDARSLDRASAVVLPGVGAFPDAMRNLRNLGMAEKLKERASEGVPLLGICLGMQLLAKSSEEIEPTEGLGLIDAEVVRLKPTSGERVPHMGWNEVFHRNEEPLFVGVEPGRDFYFVHSFHVRCRDENDAAATTPYCGGFVSAIRRGNVHGVQFHPEKSQALGFRVLRNFLGMIGPC